MSRIQEVRHIYKEYLNIISSSNEEWTKFLGFSSRFYKYTFYDTVLIYAQRPNARAVASYQLWKQKIGRYISKGSKSIAVFQDSNKQNMLRHLFDISDTGGPEHTKPKLWSLNKTNIPLLEKVLSEKWNIEEDNSLSDILSTISFETLMSTEINDEYLNDNLDINYLELAKDSINYILHYRCRLTTDELDNLNSFDNIIDFDNDLVLVRLGNIVADISEEILREIELEVFYINKEFRREENVKRKEIRQVRTSNGDWELFFFNTSFNG